MKLSNYVTENQIRGTLNGKPIEAFRAKYNAQNWAYNWWYPISVLPSNPHIRGAIAEAQNYPYDTEVWIPMAEVKAIWPYTRQRFFQVVNAEEINRMRITHGNAPFWVYYKPDIKKYLLGYAETGRLQKSVDDVDAYLKKVKAW